MSTYDLQTARAPRMTGFMLGTAATLLESSLLKSLLVPKLLKDTGIEAFRTKALTEAPSVAPLVPHALPLPAAGSAPDVARISAEMKPNPGFRFESITDFAKAYREGRTDPEKVAEKVLAAIAANEQRTPAMRTFIAVRNDDVLAMAKASAERLRRGAPLSVLDGVPVAVKDELDQQGYPTTAGTRFLGKSAASEDATVVARLRAAGAVLIGKANMHEIGIDTSGFNLHHGTPRNPYLPDRYTGGSSSGSAAAVAAGLCPLAVGADGGGSIRIPAGLCGVVGLKATWSRVSEGGAFPLCWSVGHVGPIAATARDAAIGYALMAGPDPRDRNTLGQPSPTVDGLDAGVKGLRLGVYTAWLEDAEKEVVSRCRELLAKFEREGATIVEIELPDLEMCRLAHAITILSEMATSMDAYAAHLGEHQVGVRLNLALARELTNRDFVRSQQVRTRFTSHVERALEKCDAIVTPTTGMAAPAIRPDVFPAGESDLEVTSALMRYVFPTNLTGHPAISFPAGYDANGAPVGMQAIGRFWDEALLLRLAETAHGLVERRAPQIHQVLLA